MTQKVTQVQSAISVVEKEAAIHVSDAEAREELIKTAVATVNNAEKLETLSSNIKKMAKPNAAQDIAKQVLIFADAFIEKETRRKNENIK